MIHIPGKNEGRLSVCRKRWQDWAMLAYVWVDQEVSGGLSLSGQVFDASALTRISSDLFLNIPICIVGRQCNMQEIEE